MRAQLQDEYGIIDDPFQEPLPDPFEAPPQPAPQPQAPPQIPQPPATIYGPAPVVKQPQVTQPPDQSFPIVPSPGRVTVPTPPAPPVLGPGSKPEGPSTSPGAPTKPTGGSLSDPAYVDRLIAWAATQPGVNPSVKNDPNYWRGAVSRFNGDEAYFIQRMFTAEGAPEGGGKAPAAGGSSGGDQFSQFLTQLLTQQNAYREMLRGQYKGAIDKYSAPVDSNDPIINSMTASYQGDADRALANYRELMAERAHAEGVPSGAFDSAVGDASLRTGRATQGYRANLMGEERQNRRNALQNILGTAQGSLNEEDQTKLSASIAGLDSQLRGRGLDQQNQQFYDDFGLRLSDRTNSSDDALLRFLLGQ